MKRNLIVFIFIFGFILEVKGEVGIGLKVGTTGPGIELTTGLKENLNLRTGIAYYNWERKFEEADSEIENGEINFLNIPLLVDWHPKGSGFRISIGGFYSDNYVKLKAKDQQVTINKTSYTVTNLNGKIAFDNKIGPYLGIGFGNAVNKKNRNWHISFDIGVIYVGSPDISLTATASDPTLQNQLNQDIQEQIKKYKDETDKYRFYPVITFGFSYAF